MAIAMAKTVVIFSFHYSVIVRGLEKNLENRKRWKADIVPTLVFFDKSGREVERASGYMKESRMRALLDKLASE